jgi:hypothetical protein
VPSEAGVTLLETDASELLGLLLLRKELIPISNLTPSGVEEGKEICA